MEFGEVGKGAKDTKNVINMLGVRKSPGKAVGKKKKLVVGQGDIRKF